MIRTACNVVTGFLGSGKTTLLRHVLEHGLGGRRVAVVMNEIGDIGLEGRVIEELDAVERMVEFNSGCVCCTIDGYDFAFGVQAIVDELAPDLIIIETTGVADPLPIERRLRSVRLLPDAVIAVVDVLNFLDLAAEHEVLARQVAAADFVVQTKRDLAGDADAARVRQRLEQLNPRAVICEARFGAPDNHLLFGTSVRDWRDRGGAQADPHAQQIGSFSWRSDAPVDNAALERLLDELPGSIYRAKGCVRLTSGETRLFNFVCGRHDQQPLPPGITLPTQAVFIGRRADLQREAVLARLRACERPGADGGE